jgi:hypothetical protein
VQLDILSVYAVVGGGGGLEMCVLLYDEILNLASVHIFVKFVFVTNVTAVK